MLKYGVEQGAHIARTDGGIERGISVPRRGVDNGEVELILLRAEVDKQVYDLIDNLCRARVGSVDLVDNDKNLLLERKGLFEDEARLGHTALECVDEQKHAVNHHEYALDLAAEIGMAGSVNDVDFHAVIVNGGVLRKYGYSALALNVV